MKRTKNQILCNRSRNIILEIREGWGTGKTMLYSLKARNNYLHNYNEIDLGVFETKEECEKWLYEWKKVLAKYHKNENINV